jgi:hypothetical protein
MTDYKPSRTFLTCSVCGEYQNVCTCPKPSHDFLIAAICFAAAILMSAWAFDLPLWEMITAVVG